MNWVDVMLLMRTLLYPIAAYGFFCLATYWPSQETRGQRLMRQSCYALSAFFLLAAHKTAVLLTHIDTALADTLLTPMLIIIIVLVYADLVYLSRDRGHNGVAVKR